MKTNDLKKGDRIQLRNGWEATIEDNRKGDIRMATVYGFETEMGSVYSHDIVRFLPKGPDARPVTMEHTPAQNKLRIIAR